MRVIKLVAVGLMLYAEQPHAQSNYFPLEIGNHWTYQCARVRQPGDLPRSCAYLPCGGQQRGYTVAFVGIRHLADSAGFTRKGHLAQRD